MTFVYPLQVRGCTPLSTQHSPSLALCSLKVPLRVSPSIRPDHVSSMPENLPVFGDSIFKVMALLMLPNLHDTWAYRKWTSEPRCVQSRYCKTPKKHPLQAGGEAPWKPM